MLYHAVQRDVISGDWSALLEFWPIHPGYAHRSRKIAIRCWSVLHTKLAQIARCCAAGCTYTDFAAQQAQLRDRPTSHNSGLPCCPTGKSYNPACPPSGRPEGKKTSGQRIDCCPGSPGSVAPADGHSQPHPSFIPPLAWRGPPAPGSSLHQIQGQARETAPLDLLCCPARSTSKLFDDSHLRQNKSTPKTASPSYTEHRRQLHTIPETRQQSTLPCLRPRHSTESTCLIAQAPRRCLLFAIVWYEPPLLPQAKSATLDVTGGQLSCVA